MKLNSKITFFNEGEVVLVMDQQEGRLNGGHNKQYIFTLFNSENKKLGTLDPELTRYCGYARAVSHVGKTLLAIFPKLRLEIHSFHGNTTNVFKWTTREIENCIKEQLG